MIVRYGITYLRFHCGLILFISILGSPMEEAEGTNEYDSSTSSFAASTSISS